MDFVKAFVIGFAVVMALNFILACTARAEDIQRGDLNKAMVEATTDQDNAETALQLEMAQTETIQTAELEQ